jgi:hypothetical protein
VGVHLSAHQSIVVVVASWSWILLNSNFTIFYQSQPPRSLEHSWLYAKGSA